MNARLAELRQRYAALEHREQVALSSLSVFLVVVVFYLAVWVPVNTFLADSRADYERQLSLLTYLQSTEAQARAASASPSPTGGQRQSMLTSVSRTAQAVGVNPSRMQPEGTDAVSVWFDAVPFTSMMLWLERLESQQGIVVRQITLDGQDEPGQVSVRVIIRRS